MLSDEERMLIEKSITANVQTIILLSPAMKNALRDVAAIYRTTMSDLLREAILRYIPNRYPQYMALYDKHLVEAYRHEKEGIKK